MNPKISAGFFSFTEITDPAEHHSYNEWHQFDHLPEQLTLPGIGWGERWVSPPAYRRARTTDQPPFDAVHYLTLYLLADPIDETLSSFQALARELSSAGRFHQHRRAVLSGPFDVVARHAAARTLVSAEAVPYRPNRGVHVRVDECPTRDEMDDHVDRLSTSHLPALVALPGVAGAWAFRSRSWRGPSHESDGADERSSLITVAWLDAPPLDVLPAIGALPGTANGSVRTLFDGPFERIIPWAWEWFDQTDAESTSDADPITGGPPD